MKDYQIELLQAIKDDPEMPDGLYESFEEVFAMSNAGLEPEEIHMIQERRHGQALAMKLDEMEDIK